MNCGWCGDKRRNHEDWEYRHPERRRGMPLWRDPDAIVAGLQAQKQKYLDAESKPPLPVKSERVPANGKPQLDALDVAELPDPDTPLCTVAGCDNAAAPDLDGRCGRCFAVGYEPAAKSRGELES